MANTHPRTTPRKQIVAAILFKFQQRPALTYRLYDVDIGLSNPLHCFLRAGEDVESVQALCEICPNLLKLLTTQNIAGNTPIWTACKYGSSQVIRFLIQQSDLVGDTAQYDNQLFQYAMENTANRIENHELAEFLNKVRKIYKNDSG